MEAQRVGGQASVKRSRTETGVKDVYQGHFLSQLFSLTTKRGQRRAEKLSAVADFVKTIPHANEFAVSPVWRIHGKRHNLYRPLNVI